MMRAPWLVVAGAVAGFLARALGGPFDPTTAADLAAAIPAERIPAGEVAFAAVEGEISGLRTLAGIALPGATHTRSFDRETEGIPAAPAGEP